MKSKLFGILICIMLIAVTIPIIGTANIITNLNENIITCNSLDGGWLEERNGVKILHLNGSYYDMGFAHGILLKDDIWKSYRTQLVFSEKNYYDYERILSVWYDMEPHIPERYKEEMQGLADGANMTFEQVAIINTIPEIFNTFYEDACCQISLWGDATTDGKLYHVRSYDWPFNLTDPETGTYFQTLSLIFVRAPENGYASIIPEYAGDISAYSGINEKGIAVGEDTCFTEDITREGISPAFRMRMVMDEAATIYQAIDILAANRTCGTNFVVSDGKIPVAYALDQTANISYVGKWNDPVEATYPFWQIKDVVRRSPMYIYPDCAAVELGRIRYNPAGIIGLLNAILGRSYSFIPWTHYRALSNEVERRYGALDLNESMSLLRDEYTGKTDLVFRFGRNNLEIFTSHFQWVACPETNELVISFATADKIACYNEIHYFNMAELWNANPP